MTDAELRKLKRVELLELLLAQSKETEELRAQLEQAQEQLRSREIQLSEAGSIAEASLRLNGIFETAQSTAEQYLENIRRLSGEQEEICRRRDEESRAAAEQRLRETEEKCRAMTAAAEQESRGYWVEVSKKLEAFYADHQRLRELLAAGEEKQAEYHEG